MPKRKLDVEVVDAKTGASGAPPLVAIFPTGPPGPEGGAATAVYRNSKWNRSNEFVAIRQQETLDYVGRTFGPENEYYQPCSFVIGIHDKKARRLRILPIAGNRLCRMEPRLHRLDYGQGAEITKVGEGTVKEGRARLLQAFGSETAKRRVRNAKRSSIDAATIQAGDAMTGLLEESSKVARAEGKSREQVLAAANYSSSLPPCDLDACTGEIAYPFARLCPPPLWPALNGTRFTKATTDAEVKESLEKSRVPAYVMSRLCKAAPDGDKSEQKAVQLAFLGELIRLYDAPNVLRTQPGFAGLEKLAQQRHMDCSIVEHLLGLFYNRRAMGGMTQFQRPDSQLVLHSLYVLVVALLIDDCSLDAEQVDQLARELKIRLSVLTGRFRHLGCSVRSHTRAGREAGYSVTLLLGTEGKSLRDSLMPIRVARRR
ncbi:unnamed protein product [Ostreobium quekettii]|uniref:Uncharacterized protein n=1 Tax=Ostreobium quekettii TaxID=121088 RepID=A0A8S1J684_9CHLO|nr:unnamed protein product [Ostreobium quekettii]|eukprot:evm.model.scf_2233EXC.3 EVM.evm.TU.scf_2233EXC.3   scf_2233EXC:10898-17810(-)